MKKIKLNKKVNTLRNQAWTNLVCAAATLPLYSIMLLPDTPLRDKLGNIFVVIVAAVVVLLCIYSSGKNERADELSTANMNRAGSISAVVAPVVILAVGAFVHMRGNFRDDATFNITGGAIVTFGCMIAAVTVIVKNGVFLWLDRTSETDDAEEE